MRESTLFRFPPLPQGSHDDDTTSNDPSVFISIPSSSPSITIPSASPAPTWAGLADQHIAWRLLDATTLRLQHIVTHSALTLTFSAAISTRPVFLSPSPTDHTSTEQKDTLSLIVACHTTSPTAPATILHLHISRTLTTAPARPYSVERQRYYIPSVKVTAIQSDFPDVILSLSDGRLVLLPIRHHSSHPPLTPISPTSLPSTLAPIIPQTLPDLAAQAAAFSASSSRSFVSRLFKSKDASESTLNSDALPPHTGTFDPIFALSVSPSPSEFIATLHLSGRVCLFTRPFRDASPTFTADLFLPCRLSTTRPNHFLLSGPDATVLAVVLADEHPAADSLRVFEISPRYNVPSDVDADADTDTINNAPVCTLSCRQLLSREGPIPPLVSAVFFAEDVVVATPAGTVTALLNEPHHVVGGGSSGDIGMVDDDAYSHSNVARDTDVSDDAQPASSTSRRGLPGRTLWTAVDDVDEPFGLARSIDRLPDDGQGHLLSAHRFSPSAIAKALRLQNAHLATREYIVDALTHIGLDDEENGVQRMKHRAEQITKAEDMRVCDLSWSEDVGLVVARENGLHIMRPLFEAEKRVYAYHDDLLTCDQDAPRGATAWLLASHAACQNVAAQFLDSLAGNSQGEKVLFMLSFATRFSRAYPHVAMTDLLCSRHAELCLEESGDLPSFPGVMHRLNGLLQPGAPLLSVLHKLDEIDMLGEAAEQCIDILPISSSFANGIVWLDRFRRERTMGVEADVSLMEEEKSMEEGIDQVAVQMLNKAFAFFVLAAEACGDETTTDDIVCSLELAGYHKERLTNGRGSSFMDDDIDWRMWEIAGAEDEHGNVSETVKLGECAFWLLEKALRMTEMLSVPKTSATIALQAMKSAPNKQKHEQMMTKAFNHFLDCGHLKLALDAILSKPFRNVDDEEVSVEEAEALKDSIGHFINRTADANELKWLAEQDLPEPLRMLCGQALERRARGVEVLDLRVRKRRFGREDEVEELGEGVWEGGEYEDLYAWHVLRDDYSSAAFCALEWAERLTDEGPELVRNTVWEALDGQARTDCSEMYVMLLLEWASAKCQALSCVQTALRVARRGNYVMRSPFALAGRDRNDKNSAVVSIYWVSRRLLLAHAQRMYLARLMIDMRGDGLGSESVDHLASEWSPLLTESRTGVEWVSSMIRQMPSYDDVSLCAELCCAWREEIGDGPLVDLIGHAARAAAKKDMFLFEYHDLDALLRYVDESCKRASLSRRNWYTIALDNALSTCAGRVSCPKWLIDAAAFGTDSLADAKDDRSKGHKGDMLGTIRALLRNNRPVDAAKVLLEGLTEAERSLKEGRTFYMSYTAVDATLETLHQMAQDYSDAELYHKRLTEQLEKHMHSVEKMQEPRSQPAEKMNDGVGRDLGAEFASAEDSMDVVEVAV